uniref:Putative oligopeptide transport protein (ABC superfamily, atp_bind) n=1 Tax=Magnetococcus massalia (strain MO-1) TaxID=451514 RepID=A0A1S7LE07_MAGMO|nr:putative oligopeptide transport protein (ABC superfamily, atp_bind) [Candidatus Magnetococcus massalia]
MGNMATPLLDLTGLEIRFASMERPAVKSMDLTIAPGETVALVGESGSGKTLTALSLLGLLPPAAKRRIEKMSLTGQELSDLTDRELLELRGNSMAMVFQEPMTALNPVYTVGRQVMEPLRIHRKVSPQSAREAALKLLDRCGLPDPERAMAAYPHQLSGGQRQRAMIAMALICHPKLLIADEPTTALDVTIQAQILDLLRDLKEEMGMAMLLISHDLPMVEKMADRIYVMRYGEVVEEAPTAALFRHPKHPYTQLLLGSLPRDAAPTPTEPRPPALYTAENLQCHFPIKRGLFKRTVGHVKALDGVDLVVRRGETLGIVGESGSGKSTLGETLLKLNEGQGVRLFDNLPIHTLDRRQMRSVRPRMQVVFQDPYSSLSPRMQIQQILEEGLLLHHPHLDEAERNQWVIQALQEVGLEAEVAQRYPHQFSGGQRQRIAIARAMILQPELLILDEPTSALDLSVQAQILELLKRLQQDHGLAYLFISHDLRVVRMLSHDVMVMQHGKCVEQGPTEALFQNPQHPYTQQLLSAALEMTRQAG